MAKRARISDNDPLSPTDDVLASFEQANKLTSQQAGKSTSRELQSAESQQVNKSVVEQARKSGSQQANKSTSRTVHPPASQQVEKLGSQQAVKPNTEVVDVSASQQVEKLTSQEVEKSVIRKSTFQLSEDVLQRLDTFHLQLQLELGRGNAPYKEVIVEEAIVQLLEQDRAKLLAGLQQRQQRRA